jgi:hypothetical protein
MDNRASQIAKAAFRNQLLGRIKNAERRKGGRLTKEERQAEVDWIKQRIGGPRIRKPRVLRKPKWMSDETWANPEVQAFLKANPKYLRSRRKI